LRWRSIRGGLSLARSPGSRYPFAVLSFRSARFTIPSTLMLLLCSSVRLCVQSFCSHTTSAPAALPSSFFSCGFLIPPFSPGSLLYSFLFYSVLVLFSLSLRLFFVCPSLFFGSARRSISRRSVESGDPRGSSEQLTSGELHPCSSWAYVPRSRGIPGLPARSLRPLGEPQYIGLDEAVQRW